MSPDQILADMEQALDTLRLTLGEANQRTFAREAAAWLGRLAAAAEKLTEEEGQ